MFCLTFLGWAQKELESVVLRYLNNMNLIHCTFKLCPVYECCKTIFCSLALQPSLAPPKNRSTTVKKKGPGTGKRVKGSPTEDTLNRQTTPEQPAGKQVFLFTSYCELIFVLADAWGLTLIQM